MRASVGERQHLDRSDGSHRALIAVLRAARGTSVKQLAAQFTPRRVSQHHRPENRALSRESVSPDEETKIDA